MKPGTTYQTELENPSTPYYWPLHHVKNGLLHHLFLFLFPNQENEPKMTLAPVRVINKNAYTGR